LNRKSPVSKPEIFDGPRLTPAAHVLPDGHMWRLARHHAFSAAVFIEHFLDTIVDTHGVVLQLKR
jgi:hypothetical protein